MSGDAVSMPHSVGEHCSVPSGACELPCAGCCEAIASVRGDSVGLDLSRSESDGCWVVKIGFSEKLRSDDPCLACSYFRNRAQLLAG